MESLTLIYIIGIVIVSLLLLYVLYRFLLIKRIYTSIPSLIYATKASDYCLHNQKTMVHIQGKIHRQFLGAAYFTGVIWVDNIKPWMSEPTQVHFPIEEDHRFYYCFHAQAGDCYCYVYLDPSRKEVCVLFPEGIYVAGPATNNEEVQTLLHKSWGYHKVDYEKLSFRDFIYSDLEFCFGSLKLNQTTKNDTIELNQGSILKSTTATANRSELRYQRYQYFEDVKIAIDNVQYTFVKDILKEINILLSYTNDVHYLQALYALKQSLDAFPRITISSCSNHMYYKDNKGKQLYLVEDPLNYTIMLRIKGS